MPSPFVCPAFFTFIGQALEFPFHRDQIVEQQFASLGEDQRGPLIDGQPRDVGEDRAQGLVVIAPTRYYGTGAENKPAAPAEEKAHIAKVWAEAYAGFEGVPILIDIDAMVRYGVSATPTYALIDRKGMVRFYSPTRLSEAELSRRIETVLAENP